MGGQIGGQMCGQMGGQIRRHARLGCIPRKVNLLVNLRQTLCSRLETAAVLAYLKAMDSAPRPEPTPDAFKSAMRGLVGACSLITVGQAADRNGLVVTTGVSLTAEPPMVLACINRASSCWPLIGKYRVFGLSVLGAADQPLAERFSGAAGIKGPARYDGANWVQADTGALLLADAPLALDCRVEEMIDRGTHSILLGRVLQISTCPDRGALLYWNGAYHALAKAELGLPLDGLV